MNMKSSKIKLFKRDLYAAYLGVKVVDVSKGRAVLSISIVEHHLNFLGAGPMAAPCFRWLIWRLVWHLMPYKQCVLGLRHKCLMLSLLMRGKLLAAAH